MKKSMMMFFCFLSFLSYVYSQNPDEKQEVAQNQISSYEPWYTGPLIADGGSNLSPGVWGLTHSIRFLNNYGAYDAAWTLKSSRTELTVNPTTSIAVGITNWLEFKMFDLQALYSTKDSKSSFNINDYLIRAGVQIVREDASHSYPSIRVLLQETFPTGKYKNLDSTKNGIDATGSGAYITTVELAISKYLHFFYNHPINFYINVGFGLPTDVKVQGFNAYGGGLGTDGSVKPGKTISALLALEYSFTQKVAFAMDASYNFASTTTFTGTLGTNSDGTAASNSTGRSHQLSLTPALEYNFNDKIGLLFSSWFSVAGRNSTDFAGGVLLLTYNI